MKLAKPDGILVADTIASIIATTGREVTLQLLGALVPCVDCAGSDPFCTTCQGNPLVPLGAPPLVVTGVVRWKTMERRRYRPEGQYPDGDCTVVVAYQVDLEATLRQVVRVEVDGRSCVLDSWRLQGSPVNRILLVLREDEDTGGTRVS